jgi:hypothetical protein
VARRIPREIARIVEWLVDHPSHAEPVGPLSGPISNLTIAGGCDCGCGSLTFVDDTRDARPIRDAFIRFDDGLDALVVLWARSGDRGRLELTELEFVPGDPRTAHRVPRVSELRTWEMLGQDVLGPANRQ